MTYQDIPEILGHNPAREYDAYYSNTLVNQVESKGGQILEENDLHGTTAVEIKYQIENTVRYGYIKHIGGASEAAGEKSIITGQKVDPKRVEEIFQIIEQKEREQMRI